MPVTPRERLARMLGGSPVPGAFSVQLSVPARDVRLTVAGAGLISFPVRAPQAKRMISSARLARFGRGEQTLMDLSVRDTWEITPDQVTLTGLDWDAILAEVRDELGLSARARLRAEPHALLVYGKGQFFLPHQDSEKDDTMIGTLVVSLPSSHTGGELVIEHNGKTVTFQASTTEVSVAAFYADCRHEVKPVRTGYRVTFTCNLMLDSDPAGEVPAEPSAEAARYLAEHFTTRVSRWKGDDREPPNRLVYLLDHQYTQRGLIWDRLKGADAERAGLLRAAVEEAGCEAVLALTEIKETWDTVPGRRGRGVDLTYIITSELTLSWWTGVPDGEPISLYVPDEQVCASTPSADLKPYDSEYTGYMGNYGNTMDRWYRRAAIVVWPRQHAFAARAESSPSWALAELRARLDAGDVVNARAAAESLAPFWKAPGPELLEPALRTAAGLEDPGIALMLLRPFAVEWVALSHAGGLAALAARYGESWHRNLLDAWFGSRSTWRYTGVADRKDWAVALPGLTAALQDAGAAGTARLLLAASWGWLGDDIRLWLRYPSPATRRKQLAELGEPLAGLLAAASGTALADEMVTTLREYGDDVLACLLPMLRAAGPGPGALLQELARDCERRLTAITGRPARADDDWSVPWSGGCGCELCGTLGEFLADRSERTLEWPLAESRRKHVKGQISAAELPVRHETWKFGRPHTGADQDRRAVPARGQGTQRRSSQPGMAGHTTEPLTEARTVGWNTGRYDPESRPSRRSEHRRSGACGCGVFDRTRRVPRAKRQPGPAAPENGLQAFGDWVLAAREQHADGAAEAARRMIAALRERDWDGDDVLADQLDALLGSSAMPDLRPLPVDLDELAGILEGDPMDGGGRVDLATGDVWPAPAVDYAREIGQEDEDESDDPDKWLWVHCEGSRDGYRDMELFIGTVRDPGRADRLEIAISGRGAFRRFKDVLARWPGELDRWYAFSAEREHGRARAWLADAGYYVRKGLPPS